MSIFNTIKKKITNSISNQPQPTTASLEKQFNSLGEDVSVLDSNGDLPFGWVTYNQGFVTQINEQINKKWEQVHNREDLELEIKEFKEYFNLINCLASDSKEKGECYYKYFAEYILGSTWYNLQVEQYSKLKQLPLEEIEKSKKLAELKRTLLPRLREELNSILLNNPKGILQADIYREYEDEEIKSYFRNEIFNMEKEDLIRKEKAGRTYKIFRN